MRHRKHRGGFDMGTSQRRAMFRSLTTAVLRYGYARTTEARAKETRRFVERMITLGKRGTLQSRRLALAFIYDPDVVRELFDEIAPRYADRPGGYTRVVKLAQRRGDASKMARLELV